MKKMDYTIGFQAGRAGRKWTATALTDLAKERTPEGGWPIFALHHSHGGWRVAQAFDLAGISNTVGAPSFAFLAKGGRDYTNANPFGFDPRRFSTAQPCDI